MLKLLFKLLSLAVFSMIFVSCGAGRLKFVPNHETTASKTISKKDPVEHQSNTSFLTNSDRASSTDDLYVLLNTPNVIPPTILDSTEQKTAEHEDLPRKKIKKKKNSSVFKRGMQLSGISSGTLAIATITFFLSSVSVYFPVVGILLCIVGIYFFVRGLRAYLDAKQTLQWYPKEYAKAQKFGWATTVLIINCVMLAVAAIGILSIIF